MNRTYDEVLLRVLDTVENLLAGREIILEFEKELTVVLPESMLQKKLSMEYTVMQRLDLDVSRLAGLLVEDAERVIALNKVRIEKKIRETAICLQLQKYVRGVDNENN